MTVDNGSNARGKAVFSTSLPPVTTDFTPSRTAPETK
jgi:hypothetical protein